jgi:very-short-patch-repair endonuclease
MTRDYQSRAKSLRANQTDAERLVWSVLRGRQLCGLKFRRQHVVEPHILDFACCDQRLCIELDGECHDTRPTEDFERQRSLEGLGWTVLRFANQDVLDNVETVLFAIANELKLPYKYDRRTNNPSGFKTNRKPK